MSKKIGIVWSQFNPEITQKMIERAKKTAEELNLEVSKTVKVPGAYDIPLAVKKLLQEEKIQGVVTLGAVIKGDTKHDDIIGQATANSLQRLSLEFDKPVTLGIIGPGASWEEAEERKEEYPKRAVEALKELLETL